MTLNVQGSCNNLCDTAPDPAEYAARNAADIAWLQDDFRRRRRRDDSAAVMIIAQADPGWDLTRRRRARRCAIRETLAETDGQPDGFQTFCSRCATR